MRETKLSSTWTTKTKCNKVKYLQQRATRFKANFSDETYQFESKIAAIKKRIGFVCSNAVKQIPLSAQEMRKGLDELFKFVHRSHA